MSEAERVWQLVRGDELLAELVVTGGDFPWLNAEVLPAAAFAEAGPLFDDELRRLELLDEEPEQWEADDLHELLTKRTGRPGESLILTSNRSSADSYLLFPSAVGGESILDRVLNTRHHLLLEGKLLPRRCPGQHQPGPADPRRREG